MKYLKYLALIAEIIGAIEDAKAGETVQLNIRGIRAKVGKETRSYELVGELKPE